MKIQFNTDHNISGSERQETYFNTIINNELERFSDHITRLEVHLSDENGGKTGQNDKRCMLEARIENKQPIAVTTHANTIEEAVNNALVKLKASLQKIVGQMKSH